jgi:putative ABC transport system permease protein
VNLRRIAWSNLRRRKARAAFLIAGLTIGIGTVVALLTLSSALRVQAQDNLERYGADIVVKPGGDGYQLSYGGATIGAVATGAGEIRAADLTRLRTIPNARNIAVTSPELLGAVGVNGRRALIMGVRPADEFRLKAWWRLTGSQPAAADQLVAGSQVAADLRLVPGNHVSVDGRAFTVSGVLAPTGSQDDELLIADLPVVQQLLRKPGVVSMVQVAALCSACPVGKMVAQIRAALPGTDVTAMQQIVTSRMRALDQFTRFGYAVAAVVVGIEVLVVFVTMMGSVNARTREIGIFRALGFRRGHVTGLILIEALVAGVVAGLLGYLIGMTVSYAVRPFVAQSGAPITWTPVLAGGALGVAVAVGAVASLYPALHASRLDPSEALRAM